MAKKASTKSKIQTSSARTVAAAAPDGQLQKLRKWNLGLAAFFAVQAVAIALYGNAAKVVPITTQYPAVDPLASEANGYQVLAAAARHLADVRVVWLLAAFLLILAASYLLLATVYRKQYERHLPLGLSLARWLGLGVAGGLLLVIIALVSGISNLGTLLLIFGMALLGCTLVPLADRLKQEGKGLLPHTVCGAALVATGLPGVLLGLGVLGAVMWDGKITTQLGMIYATGALLYVAGSLATHFRVTRRGRWADSLYAERMYMFLGAATATALAWQIAATTM